MAEHGLGVITAAIFLAGEMAGSGVLALPGAMVGTGTKTDSSSDSFIISLFESHLNIINLLRNYNVLLSSRLGWGIVNFHIYCQCVLQRD